MNRAIREKGDLLLMKGLERSDGKAELLRNPFGMTLVQGYVSIKELGIFWMINL